MIRPLRAVTIVVILAAGVVRTSAQPSSGAPSTASSPSSQEALAEAKQLNQLVEKLYREGKFQDAVTPAERALALREKTLGPMHPDVVESLNNLAALYKEQGAYSKAEPLLVRTLTIREKTLGPVHPDVAESLNNLAWLYQAQGAYGDADPLYVRALAIREKALGPIHPDVATSLNNLAALYWAQGAYGRAEPLYVRALTIREKALGPTHPDIATSLNNLAVLYQAQGAYGRAEPLYARAVAINEKALGPTHPDVANSLNNLAVLYQAQGAYGKAEPLLVRTLDIREKALGPTHPDIATSLSNLAALYQVQGAYGKAEPLYTRALAIHEKALGPMHPDVATSLSNLAELYDDQGAYGKAEPLLVRALAIREKTLGPTHPDVATSLNNLAALYQAQGAYGKAEPLLVRALAIHEKALGPTHPDIALSLNNLAELYNKQGAYGKAEPLLVRALAIREKALEPTHPDIALGLSNLASLYWTQGAYSKAEPLFVRALTIREKALGPTHRDVALSLNNLALLYQAQRSYGKAEPLLVRALAIHEKALGPTHPDVATSLDNLAGFYKDQGAYGKAEPLYTRALDIREKALGPVHPDIAANLNNLASLYWAQGAYSKAEPLYNRAIAIWQKALGPTHPLVADSLNNLASLYWAQGAYGKAEPLLVRAADIREQQLRTELTRLSESRKRALMTLLQAETKSLVSLHADAMPDSTPALELALTTILQRKGRILDSMVEGETRLRAHLTPRLRGQLDQLTQARTDLVVHLYAPAGPRSTADRAAVTDARARIDELEAALSTASAEFRAEAEPVTVAKIQAALPRDGALVEFVRYQRFDLRQAQHWQEERYVAYLVLRSGPPQWIALGEAATIDPQIDAVLAAMHGKAPGETSRAALQRLDALVLAPIRARLSGVQHLILAPDGKLNLVPFEALVDTNGHYALENYLVSYVTTGRDLLRLAAPQPPRSPAAIMASRDYGPLPSLPVPGTMTFASLPGAAAEAADLRRYFPISLLGEDAKKSALAALTGPAMLHIAAHGFYARDPGPSATRAASPVPTPRALPAPAPLAGRGPLRGMFVAPGASRSEDPADALDRAGLALAGANQGPKGIVTAREIAGFDWWGTQLVVLSACETGVGAVPSGEGVYGLRRALVLAGAASQVVSLWSVSDASTRALMRDYYGELARGTGRAEALRQAQLHLLRQPRFAHPYYWAAFIPAGDWRPLDKTVFSFRKSQP